jgi:hypothetical protein
VLCSSSRVTGRAHRRQVSRSAGTHVSEIFDPCGRFRSPHYFCHEFVVRTSLCGLLSQSHTSDQSIDPSRCERPSDRLPGAQSHGLSPRSSHIRSLAHHYPRRWWQRLLWRIAQMHKDDKWALRSPLWFGLYGYRRKLSVNRRERSWGSFPLRGPRDPMIPGLIINPES